jgi:hypothetical protein
MVEMVTVCHKKFIHFCTVLLTLASPVPYTLSISRCSLQGLKSIMPYVGANPHPVPNLHKFIHT